MSIDNPNRQSNRVEHESSDLTGHGLDLAYGPRARAFGEGAKIRVANNDKPLNIEDMKDRLLLEVLRSLGLKDDEMHQLLTAKPKVG